MTCRDFVGFLMDYLEGALPSEQRERFDAHMRACPSCITYLDTYRETVRLGWLLCREPGGPAPEDAPRELIEAILAARGGS